MQDLTSAKIIADHVSPHSEDRLTTFEVTFPRYVLAEFNTHRKISRNSASSRAIPTATQLRQVEEYPYIPRMGSLQPGMQAGEDLTGGPRVAAEAMWVRASVEAVKAARQMLQFGVHKQVVNRLLEPFQYQTVIASATEWENFFLQRSLHHNGGLADPAIANVATMMEDLYRSNSPLPLERRWHLPYFGLHGGHEDDWDDVGDDEGLAAKVSAARCARVSYMTHDGHRDIKKDLKLFEETLAKHGHNCYDPETEVLTEDGWTLWPNLKPGTRVMAVDPSNQTCWLEEPQALTSEPYTGRMYSVSGQAVDLVVTPNHNMVVSSRTHGGGWSPWRLQTAAETYSRPVRYLSSALRLDAQVVPETFGLSEHAFGQIIGFFVGDGHGKGSRVSFHLKKKRKIQYLDKFSHRKLSSNTYALNNQELSKYLSDHCYVSGRKVLPDGHQHWSPSVIAGVLDGLKNSDGSVKRETWTYSSTSKTLVDQIQALLNTRGLVGNITVTRKSLDNPRWADLYRLNVSKRTTPRVEIGQSTRSRSCSEEWIDYSGIVYCATVSTGALMVRRNGKVVVSGNSPMEHVARPVAGRHGNFTGWRQLRQDLGA